MSKSVEIDHSELKQMINKAWETKLSLNLTGTVGIGKSVAVYEQSKVIAKREEREFIDWNRVDKATKKEVINNPKKYFVFMDIRLSQYDATDLKGLPKIDTEEIVEWLIQNWLYCLTNPEIKAVVFFDELNLAFPSVLASAYQIIRDKCSGDVKLGDDVCVISAGNTLEDKGNVYEMPKPLCNRFIHATLLPPTVKDEWEDWAIAHGIDNRIISYLRFKPSHLFKFDAESPEDAFPTPRGWAEYVHPLIKGITHSDKMFQKLVSSAVGTGVATEFTAFSRLKDTIDFDDILKQPAKIRLIEQLDIQWSLVGIVDEWFNKNTDKDGCIKFLELVSYMQPEFAIITLKMAFKKHKTAMRNNFSKIKLWTEDLSKEYAKYLATN